ncbi:MAG: RagB/SusD family nutrient uptake outer membrane protein [Muribaculaceae bacterium]
MNIRIITYTVLLSTLSLTSCNDFLDKVPDNRVDLKTPDQMSQVLVDGYSIGNISLMCELSSDNFVDNNSPDEQGNRYNYESYDRIDNEIYAWDDAKASDQQDSPSSVWEGCYHAIAVANHVLEAVKRFEAEGRAKEVNAQKGEALLVRAYNHFTLANMFCQAYRGPELSKTMQGIPYVTEPEKTVIVDYARLPLSEVYEKIEKDLLEGLPLIDDTKYEVPKYHFNKRAANAFAARFFLYERKYDLVEKYATEALGGITGSPITQMRTIWSVDYTVFNALVQGYINANSPSNLMLVATNATFERRYSGKYRYTVNRESAKATIFGPGPTWSRYNFHPCYSGKLYVSGNQENGVWFPKAGELFEYTDKVAGIGWTHIVRCEFTAEEVLLSRAEARIYLGNIDGAVSDMKTWDDSRQKTTAITVFDSLTPSLIKSFYGKDPGYGIVKPLHIDEVCPSDKYSMSGEMEPFLQCLLHFRRIETIFDGYRWFDIKRYGIEITHKIGKEKVDKLTKEDPRRAFQIPAEVIAAGMEPTKRKMVKKGEAHIKSNASYEKSSNK